MSKEHYYHVVCEVRDSYCPDNNGVYCLRVCVCGPKNLGELRAGVISDMNYDDPTRLVRVRRLWPVAVMEAADTYVYTGLRRNYKDYM